MIKREIIVQSDAAGREGAQPESSKGFYLLARDASVYRRLRQVQYLEVGKIYGSVLRLLPGGAFPPSCWRRRGVTQQEVGGEAR